MKLSLSVGFIAALWLVGNCIGCTLAPSTAEGEKQAVTAPTASTTAETGLAQKLEASISVGGWNQDPLPKTLDALLGPLGIEYIIDQDAFSRGGIDPDRRLVAYGPREDVPVGTLLQFILDQVPARYRTEGGKLIILPRP